MSSEPKIRRKCWSPQDESALVDLWTKKSAGVKGERRNEVIAEMAHEMRQNNSLISAVDVRIKLISFIKKYKQYKQDLVSGAYPTSWPLYERIHRILNSPMGNVAIEDLEDGVELGKQEEEEENSVSSSESNQSESDIEQSLISTTFNDMRDSHNKSRRNRKQREQKTWKMEEEKELIAYLKENKHNIESPSARVFYTEFLQTSNFYRQWKILSNKVRNMRIKYEKAKEFVKNPNTIIMNKGETFKVTLFRICYYYEDFREIFDGDDMNIPSLTDLLDDDAYGNLYVPPVPIIPSKRAKRSHSINDSIVSDESSLENSYSKAIKRKRRGLHRLWSREEETEIAEFLIQNKGYFEKPTANRFYGTFLKHSMTNAEPVALRSKVRYMRIKYEKAKAFLKSPNASLMKHGENPYEIALRMCHFYEAFRETFDDKDNNIALIEFSPEHESTETSSTFSKEIHNDNDFQNDNKSKLWTKDDERKIIEFLRQHKDLYEILPRQFYEKLLQKTNINADLLELRNKIRNMRQQYEKACLFLKEPDQSIMKIGETPEDVALRFCYFYEQFKDIFKKETCPAPAIKPRNESEKNDLSANRLNELGAACKIRVKNMFSPMMEEDPLEGMSLNGLDNNDDDAGDSPIVDNEFYFKDEDNSVKQKDELYLKVRQKEIESNERLKRMEMSMKERIAIREIEMKEKVALKELEICQNYLRSAGEPQNHDIDQIVESFEQFSE